MTDSPKEPIWYSSGRGIFKREAGFQLATMPVTVNWQEDAAMFVDLLNKGEEYQRMAEHSGGSVWSAFEAALGVIELLRPVIEATRAVVEEGEPLSGYPAEGRAPITVGALRKLRESLKGIP